jgi:hypothetical protein
LIAAADEVGVKIEGEGRQGQIPSRRADRRCVGGAAHQAWTEATLAA